MCNKMVGQLVGCGFHFTRKQLHTLQKGGSVLALPAHHGEHLLRKHYEGVVQLPRKLHSRYQRLHARHAETGKMGKMKVSHELIGEGWGDFVDGLKDAGNWIVDNIAKPALKYLPGILDVVSDILPASSPQLIALKLALKGVATVGKALDAVVNKADKAEVKAQKLEVEALELEDDYEDAKAAAAHADSVKAKADLKAKADALKKKLDDKKKAAAAAEKEAEKLAKDVEKEKKNKTKAEDDLKKKSEAAQKEAEKVKAQKKGKGFDLSPLRAFRDKNTAADDKLTGAGMCEYDLGSMLDWESNVKAHVPEREQRKLSSLPSDSPTVNEVLSQAVSLPIRKIHREPKTKLLSSRVVKKKKGDKQLEGGDGLLEVDPHTKVEELTGNAPTIAPVSYHKTRKLTKVHRLAGGGVSCM